MIGASDPDKIRRYVLQSYLKREKKDMKDYQNTRSSKWKMTWRKQRQNNLGKPQKPISFSPYQYRIQTRIKLEMSIMNNLKQMFLRVGHLRGLSKKFVD